MIIYSIIVFLACILIFLLYTPIFLEIDSTRRLVQIRMRGVARVRIITRESKIGICLNILGWEKLIFPGTRRKRKEAAAKTSGFQLKRSTLKKMPAKILAVIRSFRVKIFDLNIDTDDYAVNALLFPFAVLLSRSNHSVRINFEGEVELRLTIENNLQHMLRAYLFT